MIKSTDISYAKDVSTGKFVSFFGSAAGVPTEGGLKKMSVTAAKRMPLTPTKAVPPQIRSKHNALWGVPAAQHN